MDTELTLQDQRRIEESIREKYIKVAVSPEGLPRAAQVLEALHYDPQIIQALPEKVAAANCGVGNPFALGPIYQEEAILDIGCGVGVDSIIAPNW
jgi:arsenite methyltransferase